MNRKYRVKGKKLITKIDKWRYVKVMKIDPPVKAYQEGYLNWGITFVSLDQKTYRPYFTKFALSEEGLNAFLFTLTRMGGNPIYV